MQALDVDTSCLVLVHGQVVVSWDQQITNLLHVDLHVADLDGELDAAVAAHNRVEDLLDNPRNDTLGFLISNLSSAHHGVRLSRTGLAVGEDGAVVTGKHIVDRAADGVVEDIVLGGVGGEHSVEGEGGGGVFAGEREALLRREADDLLAVGLALNAVLRPEPGDDFDCVRGRHNGGGGRVLVGGGESGRSRQPCR